MSSGLTAPDGSSADANGEGGSLAPSDVHDVLRNERRRLVLERLRAAEGSVTVRELAEHVASVEAGESPPPRDVRQSVYVSLQQTHLPKLDKLGIATYGEESNEITLDDHATEVVPLIDPAAGRESTPHSRYLIVAVLGLAGLAAGALGVPPFDVGLDVAVAAAALCATALYAFSNMTGWR